MRRRKPPKSVRGCKSRFHSEQPPQVLEPSSPGGAVVGLWVGCDKCTAPNPLAHPNPGSTAGISGLEAGTRIVGAQCPTRVPRRWERGKPIRAPCTCGWAVPSAAPRGRERGWCSLTSCPSAGCWGCQRWSVCGGVLGLLTQGRPWALMAAGHCGNNEPGQERGSAKHQTLSSCKPSSTSPVLLLL